MADLKNIPQGAGYILTDNLDYILLGENEDEILIWMSAPTLTNINKN